MGETAVLAEFITESTFEDIPDSAIDHAKAAIQDYLGVALYGSSHEVGTIVSGYVDAHAGSGDCTVIGREAASPPGAALANGAFGHAIDFDDTFESIVIHPTSPTFAAALAASEMIDATTQDLLRGYILGCEAAFRVGHSTYPEHYQNGWHATGTIGSFGAAATAGAILDVTADTMRQSFGIVASLSSSLKKNFGSMTKPLHAGHAAEMGLRSVLLAREGFTADDAVLEDKLGYGTVMTVGNGYDPSTITEGLGESWGVTDIGFKPYPSGVITHAAMDAMRRLVETHDLEGDNVDEVVVTLDDAASEMLIHAQPENALQAKFSIEFCLAAILLESRAGIHEFTDEYVGQSKVQKTVAKVTRAFEVDLFGDDYAGYGAKVTVRSSSGEEYTDEERYAPGSPNNPLDEDRIGRKFRECAETQLSDTDIDTLEQTIASLDQSGPVSELTTILGQ